MSRYGLNRFFIPLFIPLFLLFFSVLNIHAFDIPGLDFSGGIMWIGNGATQIVVNTDNELTEQRPKGGPGPTLGTGGVGLPLEFTDWLSLEPELSFFGTQYELFNQKAADPTGPVDLTAPVKAAPTEVEFADSVWLLSVMLDIPLRFTIRFTEKISAGGGVHNVFLFRIPILGWGAGAFVPGSTGDTYRGLTVSYFYKAARFYYPGTGLFFNWKFSERLGFYIRLRALFPLFHAWAGESVDYIVPEDGTTQSFRTPFYDQLMISGLVGIRVYFD